MRTSTTTSQNVVTLNGSVAPPETILQAAFRRFRSHRMAVVGVVMLVLIILYVSAGALLVTEAYANRTDFRNKWLPPSATNPMGTDAAGRDVLARTIYGGQITIAISVLAVSVTSILGTTLGLISGYYGGFVDNVIMRVTEAMLSIPLLFLLLVLSKFMGGAAPQLNVLGREISGSVLVVILVLGFTSWMSLARIVRAQVLSLREQDFVLAARAIGASSPEIIFRHILPNTLAPVIVSTTLGISNVILLEAYVGFLGMGVQPPTASWGNMIQRAVEKIDEAWWLWFFPGMFILITVMSISFIGDGLRDALDPHTK